MGQYGRRWRSLQPQDWRAEFRSVCCQKHKGLTVKPVRGLISQSRGVTIGVSRKCCKKSKQPHIVQVFPTASPYPLHTQIKPSTAVPVLGGCSPQHPLLGLSIFPLAHTLSLPQILHVHRSGAAPLISSPMDSLQLYIGVFNSRIWLALLTLPSAKDTFQNRVRNAFR